MFANYFLIALQGLKKQPVFSVVKILSLAIGLGCSILVIMHVQYTYSFDRHIDNWENTITTDPPQGRGRPKSFPFLVGS